MRKCQEINTKLAGKILEKKRNNIVSLSHIMYFPCYYDDFVSLVLSIIFEMYLAHSALSVLKFVILIVLLGANIEKMSRNQYKLAEKVFEKNKNNIVSFKSHVFPPSR